MLIDTIQVGKKLAFYEDYEDKMKEVLFQRVSYASNGEDYTFGKYKDDYIIPRLECEEKEDWKNRRKLTPTRSYVSSIINKYTSAVFRNEPVRATQSPTYEVMLEDADGYGNSLNALMNKALSKSQIDGVTYLLAESTDAFTEILTIAQKQSSGARPYIRLVPTESVINYEKVEGKLVSAIVLLEDENGKQFARYMDDEVYVDITLGQKMSVQGVSEAYPHGYSAIPLVEVKPFSDAQSKPLSHSQMTIVNLLSLLQQEMVDNVFSKWILSGVRLPQDDTGNSNKVSWSGKRMVVLEDAGAKLDMLGAEHGCADSLRKQIELEEKNLYYSAGFGRENAEPTNMSGFALAILREDFFLFCNTLKNTIEGAENAIMKLIAEKNGFEYIPVVYSDKYIADDNGEHLNRLRDLLALPLPETFKRLAIRNYINTFYNVSEEDMQLIEQEMMSTNA